MWGMWKEAITPGVSEDEEREVRRVAESAVWEPGNQTEALDPEVNRIKMEILGRKEWMRESPFSLPFPFPVMQLFRSKRDEISCEEKKGVKEDADKMMIRTRVPSRTPLLLAPGHSNGARGERDARC